MVEPGASGAASTFATVPTGVQGLWKRPLAELQGPVNVARPPEQRVFAGQLTVVKPGRYRGPLLCLRPP